jgi:polyphosphate kinase
VFLGSADWMPRNFFRRIEVMFPVEDAGLKARLTGELLQIVLSDNVKARQLQADGSYRLLVPENGQQPIRSQTIFQALARESTRVAVNSAFRFVPIFGPSGPPPPDDPTASNGGERQLSTPRMRAHRPRKRQERT